MKIFRKTIDVVQWSWVTYGRDSWTGKYFGPSSGYCLDQGTKQALKHMVLVFNVPILRFTTHCIDVPEYAAISNVIFGYTDWKSPLFRLKRKIENRRK